MKTTPLYQLPTWVAEKLEGFSAPLSSWFVFKPARALLDAGEGIVSRLGNRVYLPEAVFLTHAHHDHISGLLSFLILRSGGRGDSRKPVTVYYPSAAEDQFRRLQASVDAEIRRPSYDLAWRPVTPG